MLLWNRGRINGGGDINSLGLLPDKLKTELALHVNLETLRKVSNNNNCGNGYCLRGRLVYIILILSNKYVSILVDLLYWAATFTGKVTATVQKTPNQ